MELNLDNINELEAYKKAKKLVKEMIGFYIHALVYFCVISFLIFINLKYSPEYLWFLWSAFGWGIGLFFHSIRAFQWLNILGKDWEEKKIQQILIEEKRKKETFI